MFYKAGYILIFILTIVNFYFIINDDSYWIFGDIPNMLLLISLMILSVSQYVHNKKNKV